MRCVSYLGGLLILDQLKILPKIKRFAGTSGGSICALLCAIGYDINDIYNIVSANQSKYLDRRYAIVDWWYYLFSNNFGVYLGDVLKEDIRSFINTRFDKDFPTFRKSKGDNYDPTFKDIYDKYGKELLVTGTNLSKMSTDYFCPKLTPDMPVYIAIRISSSIPGLFESVMYNGHRYVDGGLCENYPLNLFCNESPYIFKKDNEEIFDKTLGFALMTSGMVIIKDPSGNDRVENKIDSNINSASSFGCSLVDFICNKNFVDVMTIVNLNNTKEKHSFLNHTITAYTPCLTTADFSASIETKLDNVAIMKCLTVKYFMKQLYE
jgi:predicted acylesterase/phospholipase RssA